MERRRREVPPVDYSHSATFEHHPAFAEEDQRPRKRRKPDRCTSQPALSDAELEITPSDHTRLPFVQTASCVRNGDLTYPRSIYQGWTPPSDKVLESIAIAIKELKAEFFRLSGSEPSEPAELTFTLSQFSIYKPRTISRQGLNLWNKWNGDLELTGLHELKTRGFDELLFDGILEIGTQRRYVQAVPFGILSIDGYNDPTTSQISAWIQSPHEAAGVWFKLQDPAPEYERYHAAFRWVATFAKYFVDYASREDIDAVGDFRTDHEVTLDDFRDNFYRWIQSTFRKRHHFQQWIRHYSHKDFRAAVAANIDYLWKEATNVNSEFKRLQIWRECDPTQLRAIPTQLSMNLKGELSSKTVVTPFVFNCFKDMYFSPVLQAFMPKPSVIESRQRRCRQLGFLDLPDLSDIPIPDKLHDHITPVKPAEIRAGDVVALPRDQETVWKHNADLWFAYVQGTRESQRKHGKQILLDLLWLYRPSDTILGNMTYPFGNELFLSDHCSCDEGNWHAEYVVGKLKIDWCPTSIPNGAFVRQTYQIEDQSFITLRQSHFSCEHRSRGQPELDQIRATYGPGDTVLAPPPSRQWSLSRQESPPLLEPYVIYEHLNQQNQTQVRKLLRRNRDFQERAAKSNELVWTDEIATIPTESIYRHCHVRFFESSSDIPTPYDRDGQLDCFFISRRKINSQDGALEILSPPFPEGMNPGFDPTTELRYSPLNMLSLFSGGGNFDRGLEEGRAVKTQWAVEWDKTALHTFKANTNHTTALFLGSVDEYLRKAILGSESSLIAQIGEVEALAAGSPCQGFSILQRYLRSIESLLNASKVASVVSFIDHYRPIYAVLENVATMTRNLGAAAGQPQNVFSQLICTLVAMGYQVNQYLLEAWSFGGSQGRRRLFITIAAPNFIPIAHPPLTHSNASGNLQRSLGTGANGEKFGISRREATPFQFVSAAESTRDLPDIGNAHVRLCVQYPDHRLSIGGAPVTRLIPQVIPTYPRRQSLPQAIAAAEKGVILPLPGRVVEYFNNQTSLRRTLGSRSWSRCDPDGLFPTIVTKLVPADAMSGNGSLHWEQPRPLTVMEARRAQGFPDEEIIIGRPADQWKIIGNSVARQVALALGMQIRVALLANSSKLINRTRNATPPPIHNGIPRQGQAIERPELETTASETSAFEAPNQHPKVVIPICKFPFNADEDEVEEDTDNESVFSNIDVVIDEYEMDWETIR